MKVKEFGILLIVLCVVFSVANLSRAPETPASPVVPPKAEATPASGQRALRRPGTATPKPTPAKVDRRPHTPDAYTAPKEQCNAARCSPSFVVSGFLASDTALLEAYVGQHPNVLLQSKPGGPHPTESQLLGRVEPFSYDKKQLQVLLGDKVKLLLVVRDPVELIVSEYARAAAEPGKKLMEIDRYVRNPSFTDQCARSAGCKKGAAWTLGCLERCRRLGDGHYADWIKVLQDYVGGPDDIHVVFAEDLLSSSADAAMRVVEHFLGLPELPGDVYQTPPDANAPVVQAASQYMNSDADYLLRHLFEPHNDRLSELLARKLPWPAAPSPSPALKDVPGAKHHCFAYSPEETVCYTISDKHKNPCFFLRGERRCLPYFLIIGWPKCGTSSLYWYLCQHPNVQGAKVKEIDYFQHWVQAPKNPATPSYYTNMFPRVRSPVNITGEATTKSGQNLPVPQRMFDMLPYARLIAMVRDPIEQLYSNFLMNHETRLVGKNQEETMTMFSSVVDRAFGCLERNKCGTQHGENWRFECAHKCTTLGYGVYVDWFEYWMKTYPREQLLVMYTEVLKANPAEVLKRTEDHLDLEPFAYGSIFETTVNVAEFRGIYEKSDGKHLRSRKDHFEKMPEDLRTRLVNFYRSHNERLAVFMEEPLPEVWHG